MARLTNAQSKKLVIGFFTTCFIIGFGTAYTVYRGQRDPDLQKKLQAIRHQVMPQQVTTEMRARPDYIAASRLLVAAINHELRDKQINGMTMALVDKNEIVWSKGFGMISETQPATPSTSYRVASISKLFTAIGVMKLVEAGKIQLDAPLSRYLPNLKFDNPFDKDITVRQLLSHRSGILREPPIGNYFDDNTTSLQKTVESLQNTPVHFEPESTVKYSNAAVTILGYLIQQISGKSFSEYMDTVVLREIDMANSSFKESKSLSSEGEMWTYWDSHFKAPTFAMGIDPAAGLHSTMPDLCNFMSLLFNQGKNAAGQQVLKPESLSEMWKPQFTAEKQGYGLGFYVMPYENTFRVQHSGVQYGIASRLYALPTQKLGVAAASNKDNANAVVDKLSNYALRLMLATQQKQELPQYDSLMVVPQEIQQKWIGTYSDGGKIISIYQKGKDLMIDDENRKLRLGFRNDSVFTNSALDVDSPVSVQEKVLTWNGLKYDKIKLPEFSYPNRYQSIVGEYGWNHNTLFIYPRYGKLFALIEWFDAYPLHEESDDFFRFPIDGLYSNERLQFIRDTSGKVVGVNAAGIYWKKRTQQSKDYVSGKKWVKDDENVFKIQPLKPFKTLRDVALKSTPPVEKGQFLQTELIEPSALYPNIKLDIRYAGNRNFMGQKFYDEPRAFLQRPAALALIRVAQNLEKEGLGLWIFDAYRPWYVTKMFWDATPQSKRYFVANPQKGSKHNRGCAVDLTLYDLKTSKTLPMPSLYDEFSKRAYPNYMGGTAAENANRAKLIRAMQQEGFTVNEGEWWHFDYRLWRGYQIGTKRFDEL